MLFQAAQKFLRRTVSRFQFKDSFQCLFGFVFVFLRYLNACDTQIGLHRVWITTQGEPVNCLRIGQIAFSEQMLRELIYG